MIATTSPSQMDEQAKLPCATLEPGMLVEFIDNPREDSLTAAVFSHLLHLPSEMFWRILREACYTRNLPNDPGEPKQLNVRPKWNYEGTWVKPDLFMRFDDFDLIIEAKIKDHMTQSRSQWEQELVAYTNEYGKERRPVRIIALGGIHAEKDEPLSYEGWECPVHMCRWFTVLLECGRLKRELEEIKNPSSQTCAYLRILNDLIAFFGEHGYVVLRWYDDFDFKSNLLDSSADSNQRYFRNISMKLQSS